MTLPAEPVQKCYSVLYPVLAGPETHTWYRGLCLGNDGAVLVAVGAPRQSTACPSASALRGVTRSPSTVCHSRPRPDSCSGLGHRQLHDSRLLMVVLKRERHTDVRGFDGGVIPERPCMSKGKKAKGRRRGVGGFDVEAHWPPACLRDSTDSGFLRYAGSWGRETTAVSRSLIS